MNARALFWVGIALMGFSTAVWAQEAKTPSKTLESFERLFPPYTPVPKDAQTWLDNLEKGILPKGANDRETFFSRLPTFFKGGPVRLYRSESNQFASPRHPRQIYFSQDGQFILAFSGDPVEGEKEAREMLKVNPADSFAKELLAKAKDAQNRNVFQFVEFQRFDKQAVFSGRYESALDAYRFGGIQFDRDGSEKRSPGHLTWNPESCTACHGRSLPKGKSINLPNWDGYPGWRGLYGSVDDRITKGSREATFLDSLKARVAQSKTLPPTESNLKQWIAGIHGDPTKEDPRWQLPMVGTQFSNLLSIHNAWRISRALASHPNYESLKYAVLAAVNGCRPIEDFVPEATRRNFGKSYATFHADTKAKLDGYQKSLIGQLEIFAKDVPVSSRRAYFVEETTRRMAAFRWIAENGFGVDASGWFQTRRQDSFDVGSGNVDLADLSVRLKTELLFSLGLGSNNWGDIDDSCAWLMGRANPALGTNRQTDGPH